MKKYIVAVLSILLLACFFCVPVSAAEINNGVNALLNNSLRKDNPNLLATLTVAGAVVDYSLPPVGLNGAYADYNNWYANYKYENGGTNPKHTSAVITFYDIATDVHLKKGDKFTMLIPCTFQAGTKPFSEYGLKLYDNTSELIGSDIRYDFTQGTLIGGEKYKISDVFKIDVVLDRDCTVGYLEMYWKRTSENWTTITWGLGMQYNYEIVYGSPDDLVVQSQLKDLEKKQQEMVDEQKKTNELLGEITADKYTPPAGGEALQEQGKLEQEVLDSTEHGRDEASKLFNDFDIGFFRDSFNAVVVLYNRIIPKWIWLDKLLVFSLTVGIFGLLVGLVQSYIGRLNANDRAAKSVVRDAKTSAYRRAMYMKGRRK